MAERKYIHSGQALKHPSGRQPPAGGDVTESRKGVPGAGPHFGEDATKLAQQSHCGQGHVSSFPRKPDLTHYVECCVQLLTSGVHVLRVGLG